MSIFESGDDGRSGKKTSEDAKKAVSEDLREAGLSAWVMKHHLSTIGMGEERRK